MAVPISLASLSTREAVIDALHRAILGIDSNDRPMLESAVVQGDDIVMELDGNTMTGSDVLNKFILEVIGPLDTTHIVSNVRVDVKDGDSTARLTAHAIAQHYRQGEGPDPASKGLLTGALYFLDLVKDDSNDSWRIKKWKANIVWRDGDSSVVERR